MKSRRLVGFIAAYFKRPVPTRLALTVRGPVQTPRSVYCTEGNQPVGFIKRDTE